MAPMCNFLICSWSFNSYSFNDRMFYRGIKKDYLITQYSDIALSFESKTIAIFITLSLSGRVSP